MAVNYVGYTKFSKLSADDQVSVLNDPSYKQYAEQLKKEDWWFQKREVKGRRGAPSKMVWVSVDETSPFMMKAK
jgi:hypothetical protein